MFVAFIFQFSQSFELCKNTHFLSIDPDAGICDSVLISVNGEFYLDDNGYWNTKSEYELNSIFYLS